MCAECKVGPEAKNCLIVTDDTAGLQLEKLDAIRLLQVYPALDQKADFREALTFPHYLMAGVVGTREHLHEDLVSEAFLTEREEVGKLGELVMPQVLDQLGLHLRWESLIEVELLGDHVVIAAERLSEAHKHLLRKLGAQFLWQDLGLNLEYSPLLDVVHTISKER